MTGFAAVTREDERATMAVTIRALNHRYLDLQLRMPQSLAAIEGEVRALVAQARRARTRRARACRCSCGRRRASRSSSTRSSAARSRRRSTRRARAGLVTGALTPGDLLRLPQAITIRERPTDADDER